MNRRGKGADREAQHKKFQHQRDRQPNFGGNRQRAQSHARGLLAGREDVIMGRNCVEETIQHSSSRIVEVWRIESGDRGPSGRYGALHDAVSQLRVPVHELSREELTDIVGSDSHQGIVARVQPRRIWELAQLFDACANSHSSVLLALDNIVDPQNFGAILRAAECFGVDGVIWSKNRGASVTPVVTKVGVGSSELVRLAPVSNLRNSLEQCKKAGYWVVGAAMGEEGVLTDSFEFPKKCVIVMGAEGDGLSHIIEQNLDFRLAIPMHGVIDSLNVSQATAVILAAATRSLRSQRS